MSWDIFVQDIPKECTKIADIPNDFKPQPIGTRKEIIEKIKEVVPFADFSNPSWGHLDSPDTAIEVNLGDKDVLTSFAFHVYGGAMSDVVIREVLRHLGLRAFDCGGSSETGIFDMESPETSYENWITYRNQVVQSHKMKKNS